MLTTALTALTLALFPQEQPEHQLWQAHLNVAKAGEEKVADLSFGLDLVKQGDVWTAFIINEPERIPVPHVEWDGEHLRLSIDHYDSFIEATLNAEGVLEGHWKKVRGKDKLAVVPFWATLGKEASDLTPMLAPRSVGGRWSVDFSGDDEGSVGIFEQTESGLTGTFLNATGDFRFLAGKVTGRQMRLSCFDGAHAFLFEAVLADDETLSGSFRSGNWWLDSWTATRDEAVQMTDAFKQTLWDPDTSLAELTFLDEQGNLRSLIEPGFLGDATIIQLFGTWCPNCHDETRYLVELHERYAERGLRIVGLAFELSGEFERDAKQIGVFRKRHNVPYPMLLAGTADKGEATLAFPAIDRLRSFPTSIFIDRTGRIRGLHSGFAGPATGQEHLELRKHYESTIESLLSEEPAPMAGGMARLDGSIWREPGALTELSFKIDEGGQLQATYSWNSNLSTPPFLNDPKVNSSSPVTLRGDSLWFAGQAWRLNERVGSLAQTRRQGARLFELGAPAREIPRALGGVSSENLLHIIGRRVELMNEPFFRAEALFLLSGYGPLPPAEEAGLIAAIQDASHHVRLMAIWAAGAANLQSARPALIKHLAHPNMAERREALATLIKLGAIPGDAKFDWPDLWSMADPLVREMLKPYPKPQR